MMGDDVDDYYYCHHYHLYHYPRHHQYHMNSHSLSLIRTQQCLYLDYLFFYDYGRDSLLLITKATELFLAYLAEKSAYNTMLR